MLQVYQSIFFFGALIIVQTYKSIETVVCWTCLRSDIVLCKPSMRPSRHGTLVVLTILGYETLAFTASTASTRMYIQLLVTRRVPSSRTRHWGRRLAIGMAEDNPMIDRLAQQK